MAIGVRPLSAGWANLAPTDTKVLWNLLRCLTDPMEEDIVFQKDSWAGFTSNCLREPAMVERNGQHL
jgi:hypothetical protein